MYRLIRYAQPLVSNAAAYGGSRWSGLEQELDSLFGSLTAGATRSIPVSVSEDKDNVQVVADLPGVQRADLTVEIVDDVLSIRAVRKQSSLSADQEQTAEFARDLNLPYPVQNDKVSAELKDGVLRLTLPKVEAVKPRKIDIS